MANTAPTLRAALRAFCEGANFVPGTAMLRAVERHVGIDRQRQRRQRTSVATVVPTMPVADLCAAIDSIEPPVPLTITAPPVPDEEEI